MENLKESAANRGIGQAASTLDKIISPVSLYLAYIGSAVLALLVLMLIYTIIARRAFNAPLMGSFELTELCLVVIIFTILAFDSLKHESMIVELVVNLFPERSRLVLAPIILLLSVSMLALLSWQLFSQGQRVQGFHQTTRILQIPIFPFLYLAAFGVLLLALVYLKHFLQSLDKAVNG